MSFHIKKYFTSPATAVSVFALFALGAALFAVDPAFASVAEIQNGVNATGAGGGDDLPGIIANVVNILLFLIGVAAVLMLIIGGFRYVTANGDSSAITGAKNTILYAIIGIIVALAAFAIVNFVLNSFA